MNLESHILGRISQSVKRMPNRIKMRPLTATGSRLILQNNMVRPTGFEPMAFRSAVWLVFRNRTVKRGARLCTTDPIWIRLAGLLRSDLEFSSHKHIDLLGLIGRDEEI